MKTIRFSRKTYIRKKTSGLLFKLSYKQILRSDYVKIKFPIGAKFFFKFECLCFITTETVNKPAHEMLIGVYGGYAVYKNHSGSEGSY